MNSAAWEITVKETQPITAISPDELAQWSYEQSYTRLQTLLEALESGELSLEDSLHIYEMGTRLAGHCAQKLEEAELRVQRWQAGNGTQPFTEWSQDNR